MKPTFEPDFPATCSPPPWPAEPYPRVALIPTGSSATYQDSPYRRSMLSSFASAGGAVATSSAAAAWASGHGAAAAPGADASRNLLNHGPTREYNAPQPLDTSVAVGLAVGGNSVFDSILVPPSDALPDYVLLYVQHYVYFGPYLLPSFADTFFADGPNR